MHFMSDEHIPREGELPLYDLDSLSFRYPDGTYALHDISLMLAGSGGDGWPARNSS